jgi:hypothetical protein
VKKASASAPQKQNPLAKIGGAFRGFFQNIGKAFKKGMESLAGGVVLGLSRAADVVGTVTGTQKAPRPLFPHEKDLLRKVYGDGIDLEKTRVVLGGPNTISLPPEPPLPKGIGNTIYWPTQGRLANMMGPNGIKPEGEIIFVHEAAHVAQFQRSGSSPLGSSLFDQLAALTKSGDRNDAYAWEKKAKRGIPWDQLGAEEQAHLVEEVFSSGLLDGRGRLVRDGVDLSDYALVALAEARAGRGWA